MRVTHPVEIKNCSAISTPHRFVPRQCIVLGPAGNRKASDSALLSPSLALPCMRDIPRQLKQPLDTRVIRGCGDLMNAFDRTDTANKIGFAIGNRAS
jgi:hypothetical protein